MIDLTNFRNQWQNTQQVQNGYTRVNVKPLECYIGYNNELCKSMTIVNNFMTKKMSSSKAIDIKQGKKENRFQIEVSLISQNLEEVFVRMCHDLLKYSEDATDEKPALKKFEQRYKQWQNLFEGDKTGLLTIQEQHGLIGELLFLRSQILAKKISADEAVSGWYGPLNEHQDFSYRDKWYEIKTVMEQAKKVQISSLEQLSRTDSGELVLYRLTKISGKSNNFDLNCFTLNDLVKNLLYLLKEEVIAKQKFQTLLFQVGYIEREEYSDQSYKLTEKMNFDVNDKFPRLIKEKLPRAFVSASYSLNIVELKFLKGDAQ